MQKLGQFTNPIPLAKRGVIYRKIPIDNITEIIGFHLKPSSYMTSVPFLQSNPSKPTLPKAAAHSA